MPGVDRFVRRVEDPVILQLNEESPLYDYPTQTIPSLFANVCRRYKSRLAFVSVSPDGDIKTITYETYYRKAIKIAKGLIAAGLKPFEGVGFMSHNTYSMFCAVMGAILAGGVYIDLYASNNKTWLINTMTDSRVAFVFVDSVYSKDIQMDVWDELVTIRSVVIMVPWQGQDPRVITLHQLQEKSVRVKPQQLAMRLGMHAPNRCCAVFYRSNETLNQLSTPGVMMSHDNLIIMAKLIGVKITDGELGRFPDAQTKCLKFITTLTITKPAAFVMELLLPLVVGGCVHTPKDNLSMSVLWRMVRLVEPNILCASNRVWIHLKNKLTEKSRGLTSIRGSLLNYAKRNMLRSKLEGSKVSKLARAIIMLVGERLGLSKVGLFFCFGSALPESHFEFFLSLNIHILTIREFPYLSGPHSICLNSNESRRVEAMGTIFSEFKTNMVRLGKTGASQMFVKGRHVCMGILHGTMSEQLNSGGYLDTEALTMTVQGELFCVGSSGDEIVLKTGAVLSSKCVESSFKRLVPIIASCMLVGDNMQTAALLITLKTVINPVSLQPTDAVTQEVQAWCEQKLQAHYTSAKQLACCKKLHVLINGALTCINQLIKRSGAWIEAYKILPRSFSIVDQEIDLITQELNRNLILDLYRDDLVTLYPKNRE